MNKFYVLQAVLQYLPNELRMKNVNDCSECPACPLHSPPTEDDYILNDQDLCSICLEPYDNNMFYCDLHAKHRLHEHCLVKLLIHSTHDSQYVLCPMKCGGSMTRLTNECAMNVLLKSNLTICIRKYYTEFARQPVPQELREHLLRTQITYIEREIAMLRGRRAELRGHLPPPPEPVPQPIPTYNKVALAVIFLMYVAVTCVVLFA